MRTFWKYFLALLLLVAMVIWASALSFSTKKFRLIACDVGQGDAILATYGSSQILTDGGLPNGKVLDCLSRHMPFWDRTIEIVVNTHPEKDHYGGLIEVVDTYKVENFVVSGMDSSSREFEVLQQSVQNATTRVVRVSEGQSVRLGLMRLDILHPSEQYILSEAKYNFAESKDRSDVNVLGIFSTTKNKNDFSIVSILSFGEFNALLTGDIEDKVSDKVAEQLVLSEQSESKDLAIEYLKVPHHGSKNGLSQKLLDAVNPKIAVISLGKNNSYGHPHEEVIKMLTDKDIKILRTDIDGDSVVESDGKEYWLVNR